MLRLEITGEPSLSALYLSVVSIVRPARIPHEMSLDVSPQGPTHTMRPCVHSSSQLSFKCLFLVMLANASVEWQISHVF